MLTFARTVVKKRKLILIIGLLLLIPSMIGYLNTGVNYDVLLYLPDSMETVQGQDILLDEFDKGGFAMVMFKDMTEKDINQCCEDIENIDHVDSVIAYDTLLGPQVPEIIVPNELKDVYEDGDTELIAVFFNTPTSDVGSIHAVQEIRKVCGKQCFVSGMSAFVTDLKELSEHEEPIYVAIAVILATLLMALLMDSSFVAVVFVLGIGMAILYNMGSNLFLGEISYITKAIAAVLQLAVTMDYSIFLWHSYEEHRFEIGMDREEAMANAIAKTLVSVTGSSITTIAGFLALCFMTFTLGLNLGVVMAKGVLLGVITSVTVLPALILGFEKLIFKTKHKPLMIKFDKLSKGIVRRPVIMVIIFLVLLGPALFGYTHTQTYYKLDEGVPQNLPFNVANNMLRDDFGISTQHMILVNSDLSQKEVGEMMDEIKNVDGVKAVLGLQSALGPSVPQEILPSALEGTLVSDHHQLLLVTTEYEVASDEIYDQLVHINKIIKSHDKESLLIGESACTKDLIDVTDRDFKIVTAVSVGAIFLIILFVLQSLSLPFILVACIELAIFINLGIPFYTGTVMSFIDSICISTIQLGATVDYAILFTNRYKRERNGGLDAAQAVIKAHSKTMPSVCVSAIGFFAATFGVSVYSDIDIISSMVFFMARGAAVSMLVVMFMLPALIVFFDKIIIKTSKGFENVEGAYHSRRLVREGETNE
ncbi:MAG: MMPL family transporter [Firmicutes bacterium]|nr:MMPL family transporter [Bacillota bacterium]